MRRTRRLGQDDGQTAAFPGLDRAREIIDALCEDVPIQEQDGVEGLVLRRGSHLPFDGQVRQERLHVPGSQCPWVTVGPSWADALCTGTLSKEVEHTEVEAALIDTPIIDLGKIKCSRTEIKIGYEFTCNMKATPTAWDGGGVLRSVHSWMATSWNPALALGPPSSPWAALV